MRKIFLLCVTCFCLFLIIPTIVHGEKTGASTNLLNGEEVEKSRSILFGNVKMVDIVSKDKTETNLSKPSESKSVTSIIEATGNLLIKAVTDSVGETTATVTNVVNDTDASETVKKITSSVQTVVENTGEFVNETLNSTSDVSIDKVIKTVETVDTVDKVIKPLKIVKDDEKTISGNENSFTNLKKHSRDVGSVPVREPIIPLAPEIGTDIVVEQVGTSEREKQSDIDLDDGIEISLNGEFNLGDDSISEKTTVDQQWIVKELKVLEQASGLIGPIINSKTDMIEKKNVDNPTHPTESSQKWASLPRAIIMGAPPPTESPTSAMGGQSDLSFWGIVDMFTLKSSSVGKWKHTNEYAMVKWAHAPPGKPPQQSPFLYV